MSSFTDFFPAAGGGGGIPKYQEFTSSGTFTPTQALIDAGGRMGLLVVGGGGGGITVTYTSFGAGGGEVLMKYATLTNTNNITVTIGAGGTKGSVGTDGGNTTFAASSAGGVDAVAQGGGGGNNGNLAGFPKNDTNVGAGFGGMYTSTGGSAAGSGVMGYGVGGGARQSSGSTDAANQAYGNGGSWNGNGVEGFVRVTWFE